MRFHTRMLIGVIKATNFLMMVEIQETPIIIPAPHLAALLNPTRFTSTMEMAS